VIGKLLTRRAKDFIARTIFGSRSLFKHTFNLTDV
jgi:hypothetical protein